MVAEAPEDGVGVYDDCQAVLASRSDIFLATNAARPPRPSRIRKLRNLWDFFSVGASSSPLRAAAVAAPRFLASSRASSVASDAAATAAVIMGSTSVVNFVLAVSTAGLVFSRTSATYGAAFSRASAARSLASFIMGSAFSRADSTCGAIRSMTSSACARIFCVGVFGLRFSIVEVSSLRGLHGGRARYRPDHAVYVM